MQIHWGYLNDWTFKSIRNAKGFWDHYWPWFSRSPCLIPCHRLRSCAHILSIKADRLNPVSAPGRNGYHRPHWAFSVGSSHQIDLALFRLTSALVKRTRRWPKLKSDSTRNARTSTTIMSNFALRKVPRTRNNDSCKHSKINSMYSQTKPSEFWSNQLRQRGFLSPYYPPSYNLQTCQVITNFSKCQLGPEVSYDVCLAR